jgi:hypothetical protein
VPNTRAETAALHRLIYCSRAQPMAIADPSATVRDILDVAQTLNLRDGLTGVLLASDGWFLQVLEGPLKPLRGTFARIRADQRHSDIKIVQSGPIPGPTFAQWTMCGQDFLPPMNDEIIDVFAQRPIFDPRQLKPWEAMSLLRAVQTTQETNRDLNALRRA